MELDFNETGRKLTLLVRVTEAVAVCFSCSTAGLYKLYQLVLFQQMLVLHCRYFKYLYQTNTVLFIIISAITRTMCHLSSSIERSNLATEPQHAYPRMDKVHQIWHWNGLDNQARIYNLMYELRVHPGVKTEIIFEVDGWKYWTLNVWGSLSPALGQSGDGDFSTKSIYIVTQQDFVAWSKWAQYDWEDI